MVLPFTSSFHCLEINFEVTYMKHQNKDCNIRVLHTKDINFITGSVKIINEVDSFKYRHVKCC